MEGADGSFTVSQGGGDIADVDAWLRRHLGRQLTIALVAHGTPLDDAMRRLHDALAAYGEIRVLMKAADGHSDADLDSLASVEPEIVLVWAALPLREPSQPVPAAPVERTLRHLLDDLDTRGLPDRAFVALIGPGVTREGARRLGFEDGFPAQTVPAELAAALAREGVAVDERRRRGSSPPCYL